MSQTAERAAIVRHTCYVCHLPAEGDCQRCRRPICEQHTIAHAEMHWDHFYAGGSRGGGFWTRYLPTGAMLAVCPECDATLNAEEAPERARDRVLVRKTVFTRLAALLAAFGVIAVPILIGNIFCR